LATVAARLDTAAKQIAGALGLEKREARLEAQVLASCALNVNRAWLIAHDQDVLTPAQADAVKTLVARRAQGEPVAYILGEKEFYGHMFKVTPDVLIPRPETELLVEAALERLPKDLPAQVLDLGTGSGCIAVTLALERPDCTVTAVDISVSALQLAKENAERLGAPIYFIQSDLFAELGVQRFDLIVSNPPYIAHEDHHLGIGDVRFEPGLALVSGSNGLDALKILTQAAPRHLQSGGWLVFEHGWDQAEQAIKLITQAGFMNVECLRDIAGHNRVTLGQWRHTDGDH